MLHKRSDLLDIRFQQLEESTRSWEVLQQNVAMLQSEVTVIKSMQIELLTTMQCVDNMLQKLMSRYEQDDPIGDSRENLSPIAEEQEQVASSGGVSKIEDATIEEPSPQTVSS